MNFLVHRIGAFHRIFKGFGTQLGRLHFHSYLHQIYHCCYCLSFSLSFCLLLSLLSFFLNICNHSFQSPFSYGVFTFSYLLSNIVLLICHHFYHHYFFVKIICFFQIHEIFQIFFTVFCPKSSLKYISSTREMH